MLLHMCRLADVSIRKSLTERLSTLSELTLQTVGAVSECQSEVVVGGAVGVQRPRHLSAADEAVLAAQHDDRAVDQLHDELLGLTWSQKGVGCLFGVSELLWRHKDLHNSIHCMLK